MTMLFLMAMASATVGAGQAADTAGVAPVAALPVGTVICVPVDPPSGSCSIAPAVAERDEASAPPTDSTEIVVTADKNGRKVDPLRGVNEVTFNATTVVDDAVVGPVARTYKRTFPRPLRDGVRNFLNNLHEPVVAINYLVQLKPGKTAETVGRFAINSTVGVAGLFDFARRRPVNLPRRPNGFADTLGYYGVKPGAYLFLPLIGPTTVRDLAGGTLDGLVLPTAVEVPFRSFAYAGPTGTLRGLDRRAEFDERLTALRENGGDVYAARRALYLKQRQKEIDTLHGRSAETE